MQIDQYIRKQKRRFISIHINKKLYININLRSTHHSMVLDWKMMRNIRKLNESLNIITIAQSLIVFPLHQRNLISYDLDQWDIIWCSSLNFIVEPIKHIVQDEKKKLCCTIEDVDINVDNSWHRCWDEICQ